MRRGVEVTVAYDTGAVLAFRCTKVTVGKDALGQLSSLRWTDAEPEPMWLGIDSVVAVYVATDGGSTTTRALGVLRRLPASIARRRRRGAVQ